MAEMPTVTRRGPGMSEAAVPQMPNVPRLVDRRSTAEGLDIPYRIGSEAYGRVNAVVSQMNDKRAEQKALVDGTTSAVSRDENGAIGVTFLPAGTIANDAYNRGAIESYKAQFQSAARAKATELHQQNMRDPQGFRLAYDAYQEVALASTDDRVRTASTVFLADLGQQHHAKLMQAQYTEKRQQQKGHLVNQLEEGKKDALALLGNGKTLHDPMFKAMKQQMEAHRRALIAGGFATEAELGVSARKFDSDALSAYVQGSVWRLLPEGLTTESPEFRDAVVALRDQIVAGNTEDADINAASSQHRLAAGDAFVARMMSSVGENKQAMERAKAEQGVAQAALFQGLAYKIDRNEPVDLDAVRTDNPQDLRFDTAPDGKLSPRLHAALVRAKQNVALALDKQTGAMTADSYYGGLYT
ncbi:MAG: hypothetical protein O3A51_03250, partial [Verrucomicrobia bacterium]|nr:hypothetical protein [Verrucomicrobiota bacterium]